MKLLPLFFTDLDRSAERRAGSSLEIRVEGEALPAIIAWWCHKDLGKQGSRGPSIGETTDCPPSIPDSARTRSEAKVTSCIGGESEPLMRRADESGSTA
ncbi:hypothetical protein [Methanosphaerula palustris]|uniref:Uncharacterized protein n=1 Tax=Methanosphaerula palustris (strain ATCC BAA-1556 / DSM 19958 / E1-9c) TaxID=521011 RepID=B8GES3_METPE|nr:hypothetical protein [Methanosphaerula palustris]ACL17774.1 hypothetical protein Mpal_2501 [Methanosphaerula palustris E1-9c]